MRKFDPKRDAAYSGAFSARSREGHAAMRKAEEEGRVADSLEVRKGLMARVKSGEMSLQEAQAELARIKRSAKRRGMVTRTQAYRGR